MTSGAWAGELGSAGIAAALTFALVALAMGLVGVRVGAPGAEERATMIVVSLLGM